MNRERSSSPKHARSASSLPLCLALAAALLLGSPAGSQELEGVSEGPGTAERADDSAGRRPGEGSIQGQVFDQKTARPVPGVSVIVLWPDPGGGVQRRQEVVVTDGKGEYRLPSIPPGRYDLRFVKSGYRTSAMTGFEVRPGQSNVADFPLLSASSGAKDGVLDLEQFVVDAGTVDDMMGAIELRLESDQLLNVMSAADFSKFAASDVADALKRVSGVNVVEGRFAIIRGLEDRYSSTLFNGAPVPSPDPTSQSIQLDLFAADIVSSLEIAKTFEPASPSNSSGGSIDILTRSYPEEITLKFTGGSGWNENAYDDFLELRKNSPVGRPIDGSETIEQDFSGSLGGTFELFGRVVRFRAVGANEVDYETAKGTRQEREPRIARFSAQAVSQTGGLALGELFLSGGHFDRLVSERTEQDTYFGAVGTDLDDAGQHRLDATFFHTRKQTETVERQDNGFIPSFDYASATDVQYLGNSLYGSSFTAFATRDSRLNDYRTEFEQPQSGPLSFLPQFFGESVEEDRKLWVYQLNGEHDFDFLEGLSFDWVANYAKTKQSEAALRMRYWYEPFEMDEQDLPIPDRFPAQVSDFDPDGSYRAISQDVIYLTNEIDEDQWFVTGGLGYEFEPFSSVASELGAGFWYEKAERNVEFQQIQLPQEVRGRPGVVQELYVQGATEAELGHNMFRGFGLDDPGPPNEADFEREIVAGYFDGKLTFWEDLDLVGGLRIEDINITSDNRPFTGDCATSTGRRGSDPTRTGNCVPDSGGPALPGEYLPAIFPGRYLYLDRLDNPNNPFLREDPDFTPGGISNDQILGIDVDVDQNGFVDLLSREELLEATSNEIDELYFLPAASTAYRPVDGLTVRGAYSQTVARPSFRELGYYTTIRPGSSDRFMGNPQLELSEVESFDARVEYVFGDFGDLVAASFFYKTIDKPIEVIVLRDFAVKDFPYAEGPFRVYRNNENEAELMGIELEARLTLDVPSLVDSVSFFEFLEPVSFLQYFSIGGNYTYIDAEVERSQVEIDRATDFFRATPADQASGAVRFDELNKKRRLFNQPEWIANADVTFDQPDWGTKLTLSYFAISEVLNAAGSASLAANGRTDAYVLDEFTDSFYQLDAVASQSFEIPFVPGEWTVKASVKNLTDSIRKVVYDPEQTNENFRKDAYKVGRDYSFSLGYEIAF